jgi:transposase
MSKKRKKTKTGVKKITQFEIIRPNVAGIDVSDNDAMMVSYPISVTEIKVEAFECYTQDLRRISATLKEHHIESVAMESTGVYWIPLFLLLQEDGFEVYLVNSKHTKNVTGRKDDEVDAEWIQKLHRCGLLTASFQPDNQTRTLRSVVRHRNSLIKTRSTYLNRMQKALEHLFLLNEVDIASVNGIYGINESTALTIYSEIGDNLSRFKNEKHFTSWLGLTPNNKISGGKIISSHVQKKKHSAGQAFRMAAFGLCSKKSPLADYYRRLCAKVGRQKALVALARKIAIIYFKMITTKQAYNPQSLVDFQQKYKEKKIKQLEKYLIKLKQSA